MLNMLFIYFINSMCNAYTQLVDDVNSIDQVNKKYGFV